MASNRAPASAGADADWTEHEKTYRGFLWIVKFSAATTVVVLVALYYFLAR